MKSRSAFSLVELLVVIAIVALLSAMLLPVLSQARTSAYVVMCAANMRQQGVMVGQYAADSKARLPMPTTAHRLSYAGDQGQSGKDLYGGRYIYAMSCDASTGYYEACPLGTPRIWPTNYGWFYWYGYVAPVIKARPKSLGIFTCPGTAAYNYVFTASHVIAYGQSEIDFYETQYNEYSGPSGALASRNPENFVNPGGVNPGNLSGNCCFIRTNIGYACRGWAQYSVTVATPNIEDWSSAKAWAVDDEHWLSNGPGNSPDMSYPRKHGGKINIMFVDGHVNFGGADLKPTGQNFAAPAPIFYSMRDNGMSYSNAQTGSTSCMPYYTNGTTFNGARLDLWNYYETGVQ